MNQEIKTQWIKALRSGKYSQTTETLQDSTGFCCLGVLCDVIDPTGWNENSHRGSTEYPSSEILVHAEIYEGGSPSEGVVGQLADMNDEQQFTFLQIADWVEENL